MHQLCEHNQHKYQLKYHFLLFPFFLELKLHLLSFQEFFLDLFKML